jgi:acetyl/propionyl-CoA carboxylase alpha subunit
VLVVAEDRGRAIDRLHRALDEVTVTGVQTTLPFHRFVARHDGFRQGTLSTDWVEDHWTQVVDDHRQRALEAAQLAAAAAVVAPRSPEDPRHDSVGRTSDGRPLSLRKDGDKLHDGWVHGGRTAAMDRWPK